MSVTRAAGMVLAAGVLFSTGGAAVKLCAFEALQVAWLRAAFAVPVLLALLPGARRLLRPGPWLVAAGYAGTLTLFVVANKLTTAANAIFLQSTAPFWVLIASPRLLGERPRRSDVPALLAVAGGMVLVFAGREAPSGSAPEPGLGNLAALGAGLCYGLTLTGFRWLARRDAGAEAAAAAGNLLTAVLCLLLGLLLAAEGGPAWPQGGAGDWLAALYLGLFQVGLAYVLLTRAMAGVRALQASLLLMAEPALTPVWAFLLLAEKPTTLALLGGALILGAVIARSHIAGRRAG